MKLVILVSIMAVILVESQFSFPKYYHPRLLSPMFGDLRYVGYPYQFSDDTRGLWLVTGQSNSGLEETLNVELNEQTEGRTTSATKSSSNNEISPRFFLFDGSYAVQRPQLGFNRRTLVYTTTETKTIYTTTNCFASSLFPANAPQCANRKRNAEETMLLLEGPSPVQKIETTAIASIRDAEVLGTREQNGIVSSKLEDSSDAEEISLVRSKRFFARFSASTFTEFSFTTSTLSRRIDVQILQQLALCPIGNGNNQCRLSCIPIGYRAC